MFSLKFVNFIIFLNHMAVSAEEHQDSCKYHVMVRKATEMACFKTRDDSDPVCEAGGGVGTFCHIEPQNDWIIIKWLASKDLTCSNETITESLRGKGQCAVDQKGLDTAAEVSQFAGLMNSKSIPNKAGHLIVSWTLVAALLFVFL
ncbi:hypothetical protein MATL_G00014890 [Megalops atlanticus]|uniref:Uncharacterized protein n=1 Tax=Megalops atlanticus TaxID=7932 RepID=A0A9D3QK78_MEGAT|nr:hypothetical protein MATL_G00014890 [Megalops atlanticus]